MLKPAIFFQGKSYTGETHKAIRKEQNITKDAKHQEGFVDPDGKFLPRPHAKLWLRSKMPEVYARWLEVNGEGEDGELHAEDLKEALENIEKKSYKTSSVHIQDMGLFTELALTLSRSFGRVTYTNPWQNAFPSSKDTEVGEGIPGVTRVDDIHEIMDETDLFIFPDIYYGELQIYLRNKGKRVFGSKDGDKIEIYRSEAKPYFEELGIPQGPYEIMKGVKKLRGYIKEHDGQKLWVKIDKTRGDFETFCVEGYELSKNKIDDIEYHLGPKAEIMTFVVEENLEGTIDIAIDTYCIDGDYPSVTLLGTEEKGECYICARRRWDAMPEDVVDIYERLSPILKQCEYRNMLSLESRKEKNTAYLGDPCCRGGSPPFELQMNMITNLPDIMWFGAEGKMINPKIPSRYGVMLNVHSDWADQHPLMIDFPEKYRSQIKFRYNSMFDGKMWTMPQGAGPRVAAIVAHGNNLDDIIEEAKDISKQMKGIQLEAFTRSFPIAQEKIKQLKDWGVDF
jgi:hypothetical protein